MVAAAAKGGVFSANPLSLSVPEPAFESWLRDSGYLEILDERSSSPSSSSSSAAAATSSAATHPVPKFNSNSLPPRTTTTATTSSSSASGFPCPRNGRNVGVAGVGGLGSIGSSPLFTAIRTFLSILTINPFGKLTSDDFSGTTPSWTTAFLTGAAGAGAGGGGAQSSSYSWPAGPSQARMRVQENVKRYARNYTFLSLLFLACSLYNMPTALFGSVSSLALWEATRLCNDRWRLEERHPSLKRALVCATQLATAVILYHCKIQIAILCAMSISYTVMILHASLRKLTPSKSVGANRYKRSHQKRY